MSVPRDPGHPATPEGIRSVKITHLMPLGAVWSATEGTREFDPALFEDDPDS